LKTHANIPIFIPHAGCPHTCSFCDQRAISGRAGPPTPDQVRETLAAAHDTLKAPAEIAFFGGSFTAVAPDYRRSLLGVAAEFLDGETFTGIRVSTRPDAIDLGILDELSAAGVTAIELGAQSMDDEVLRHSGRGHTAEDTREAARLIRVHGFSLGLQVMTGLPGDTDQKALATAVELAVLSPDTMRIYPALVLRGSQLEELYQRGDYRPQTLEQAIDLCAQLLRLFTREGVRVIRLGLHNEANTQDSIVAGPCHPAFRELVEGQILLEDVFSAIKADQIPTGPLTISVAPGSQSKMAGQNRRNIAALEKLGYRTSIYTDPNLGYLQLTVGGAPPRVPEGSTNIPV